MSYSSAKQGAGWRGKPRPAILSQAFPRRPWSAGLSRLRTSHIANTASFAPFLMPSPKPVHVRTHEDPTSDRLRFTASYFLNEPGDRPSIIVSHAQSYIHLDSLADVASFTLPLKQTSNVMHIPG